MYTPQETSKEHHIYQLLIPGLFLLALGIGNVAVGTFKVSQYVQVISELSAPEPGLALDFSQTSSLERIRQSQENPDRIRLRQESALARIDFYRLVIFGGKVFVALSIPFLIFALILRLKQLPSGESAEPKTARATISRQE